MGEVCEQVRQVDDILEIARGLGNAHVVATLERAQRTLLRQKAGATQLDTTVLAAARAVRQEQALELQRARALLANVGGGPFAGYGALYNSSGMRRERLPQPARKVARALMPQTLGRAGRAAEARCTGTAAES